MFEVAGTLLKIWRGSSMGELIYLFPIIFVIAIIADWRQDREKKEEQRKKEARERREENTGK